MMTPNHFRCSALLAALLVSVFTGVSAASPVEPLIPVEETWNIEDTHTEASAPLVGRMLLNGSPLAWDSDSNTYYCTLGMNQGDDWPELALTADGADDLRAAWTDDYAYDSCREAIAAGTRYDIITWTDTEEQHIGIVFTGLPIVILDMDGGELAHDDLPGRFTVEAYGTDMIDVPVYAHLRGRHSPEKFSARIELHEDGTNGIGEKQKLSVLGMPKDSDWLLMATDDDPFGAFNYMGWQIWSGFGDVITPLQSELCEVFSGNHYFGLYHILQRVNADKELKRIGGSKKTDIASRLVASSEPDDKPQRTMGDDPDDSLELLYLPKSVSEDSAFGLLSDAYLLLTMDTSGLSDEEFARKVRENLDLRNILENYILEQAIYYFDNISFSNNTYLWTMMQKDRTYRTYISPWDLEETFIPMYTYRGSGVLSQEFLFGISLPERILELDVDHSRALLREIWQEKRAGILSDESLRTITGNAWHLILDSGACRRNLDRWNPDVACPATEEFQEFVVEHQYFVEENFNALWPVKDGQ